MSPADHNSRHYSRIFLLSHMRAMTSLAGHILGSHPVINGYYEMHISYEDEAALDRQLETYLQHDELKQGSVFLFDKLLHNDYMLNMNMPALADSRLLVSIQSPEHTIKSIVDLFSRKQSEEEYASPEAATSYYIERIRSLADFCNKHRQHYFYDAELFQLQPETLLPALSTWLGLDTPLTEHYQVFSQTGKARKGDTSKVIRSGSINPVPRDYSHVAINRELLASAQESYHSCRDVMIESAVESCTLSRADWLRLLERVV